ncbi:glycosyl transferase family 1 [bacterium (candidate division B38) B3_B38]|nr:MAG: glycosyl transferase family 1 [bacterium (candidate division B38) B3_B38]
MGKIGIDIRKIRDYGIGTYIENLISQFSRLNSENQYILFCRPQDLERLPPLGENFHPVVDESANYSLREHLSLSRKAKRLSLDLYFSPHYVFPLLIPCRAIVTIHDVIHLLFPENLPRKGAYYYARFMIGRALAKAEKVVAVSHHSRADIQRLFPGYASRIEVIHNGIDPRFFRQPSENELLRVKRKFQIDYPCILFVGNLKPHKNLTNLLKAFALLRGRRERGLKLVVAGAERDKSPHMRETIDRLSLGAEVRFLGYVNKEELCCLYHLAELFAFPSFYEGFGLPPLEAMACGTPVIASNLSSLPEVLGDAAVMVNPHQVEEIAEGMRQLIENIPLREELIRRGAQQVKKYSWEEAARRYLSLFAQIFTR